MRIFDELKSRCFRWEDFPVILEFERELTKISFPEFPILDEKFHKHKLEKAIKAEPNSLIIAQFNDKTIGWIWLRTKRDRISGNKFGYIKSIYVKEEYRKRGIGKRLIQVAEEYFLNKGISRLNLIVSALNDRALSFFREMGFEETHLTMRKKLSVGEIRHARD